MSELLALSVSVAILGGIWAFLALGPLAGYALVWVGFIAAGCFFAAGGDTKALTKTIVGMIYGAIIAWIARIDRHPFCSRYSTMRTRDDRIQHDAIAAVPFLESGWTASVHVGGVDIR
jgi:Protein of unknown function (DUF1097)